MATNPTRRQVQARDLLADALNLCFEAARLDGNPRISPQVLDELAAKISGLSSAFPLDALIARALERRATALDFPKGLAEMLTLLESKIPPPRLLQLEDEAFRKHVRSMEETLG